MKKKKTHKISDEDFELLQRAKYEKVSREFMIKDARRELERAGLKLDETFFKMNGLSLTCDGGEAPCVVLGLNGQSINLNKERTRVLYWALSDALTWVRHGTPHGIC